MQLSEYITWARKEQPYSRLGFFSQPVLATDGPLAGKMLKVYPPLRSKDRAQQLYDWHQEYIEALAATGRIIPETQMELVSTENRWTPLIIQEAFTKQELVRQTLEAVSTHEAFIKLVSLVLEDTLDYLDHRASNHDRPLGFHPTLRNYAFRNETLYYFDTFPPMPLAQPELNQLIRQSLPQPWLKAISWIIPSILNRVSHEYYDPTAMVTGIIGSACRLRPEWADDTLNWAQHFIETHTPQSVASAPIIKIIQEKPKLSAGWVAIRKATKNIGKPNN